jgi:AcrR family transcriptional regulator
MDDDARLPLRERKQRRTREAIIDAAMALFAERGFDGVTVTDIAQRAEVGRSTFFRYFTDKQEVLFADDAELHQLLVSAVDDAATELAPVRTLADALAIARAGLLALVRRVAELRPAWLPLRERLVDRHPELLARNLIKERSYVDSCIAVLLRHGATSETAVLAASLAAGCYAAARTWTLNGGPDLATGVETAFRELALLDGQALRKRLRVHH